LEDLNTIPTACDSVLAHELAVAEVHAEADAVERLGAALERVVAARAALAEHAPAPPVAVSTAQLRLVVGA